MVKVSVKGPPRVTVNIAAQSSVTVTTDGKQTIAPETYAGPYTVTPKAREGTTLETQDKMMADNVNVKEIPYYDTANPYGRTLYIGTEVDTNA